jgi:cytochrome P450
VFFPDTKPQAMAPIMVSCVGEMLDRWEQGLLGGKAEVDVSKEFQVLTADVIARTAFGSNYEEGKRVFELQHELLSLLAEFGHAFNIPGSRSGRLVLPSIFDIRSLLCGHNCSKPIYKANLNGLR